jgi:hypothetical protein
MNERIRDMIEEASLIKDRYALHDEFAEQFAELLLKDVIDTLAITNANRCAYTTHDQSTLECTRTELIRAVIAAYDIKYQYYPTSDPLFPVRTHRTK